MDTFPHIYKVPRTRCSKNPPIITRAALSGHRPMSEPISQYFALTICSRNQPNMGPAMTTRAALGSMMFSVPCWAVLVFTVPGNPFERKQKLLYRQFGAAVNMFVGGVFWTVLSIISYDLGGLLDGVLWAGTFHNNIPMWKRRVKGTN